MENITKRRVIDILIFLIIVSISLAAFQPLSKVLKAELVKVRDVLIAKTEEVYGVRIKYSSMSPAFFKRILIRNVEIYDVEDDSKIAQFALLYLDYSFYSLIRKDASNVVSAVRIYDGSINFDTVKNKAVLEKLRLLNTKNQTEEIDFVKTKDAIENEIKKLNLNSINFILRNIVINYATDKFKTDFYISSGRFALLKEKINFNINSNIKYDYFALGMPSDKSLFSSFITISGSIFPHNLSASSIINFSDIKIGNINVKKFSIFASYLNDTLSVTTLQNVYPIDVKGSWNILTNYANLNVECQNLKPSAASFYFKNSSPLLEELKNSEITGFFNFNFSAKNDFSWKTQLKVDVPNLPVGKWAVKRTNIFFDAGGIHDLVRINKLTFLGDDVNIYASGSYKIKDVMPDFKLNILKFKLPNNKNLSMDLRIRSDLKNIFASIPIFKMSDAEFTDISFLGTKKTEKFDFYFSGKDKTGSFKLDGSWLHNKNSNRQKSDIENSFGYLELHGVADLLSTYNIFNSVEPFLSLSPLQTAQITEFLETIQMTSEFYASTNFKQFSYNVIQTVLAESSKGEFYSLFSMQGNEKSFDINGIDLSFNKVRLKGAVNFSFETEGIVYESLFTINDITYNSAGLYADNMLSIYGDYGLNINIVNYEKKKLKGSIQMKEFPIPFFASLFSTDILFDYTDKKHWNVDCVFAKLSYMETNITQADNNLEFEIAGNIKPNHVFFNTVKAGIKNSQLEGTASLNLQHSLSDSVASYNLEIELSDYFNTEQVSLHSIISLSDKTYLDGGLLLKNISLNRFLKTQKKTNQINGGITFIGALDALSVKINLDELNYNLNGLPLKAAASISFDDERILVEDTHFDWGVNSISNVKADADISSGYGTVEFQHKLNYNRFNSSVNLLFGFNSTVDVERTAGMNIVNKIKTFISHFMVKMQIENLVVNGEQKVERFNAELIRDPNILAIYAGQNSEIYGFKTDDGAVSLHIDSSMPVHLDIDGTFKKDFVDLNLSGVFIDLVKTASMIPNNDIVKFVKGDLTGNLKIQGTQKDPKFYGKISGASITGSSPKYSPDTYSVANLDAVFDGANLSVPYTVVSGKIGSLWAELSSEFTGWIPTETIIKCGTVNDVKGLIKTKNLAFHADGRLNGNVSIVITPELVTLDGYAVFDKGYFSVPFSELYKIQEKYQGSGPGFAMNLKLYLGKNSEFRFPSTDYPFLRAIAYTDEPLTMVVDSREQLFEMSGHANIRTGELCYVKRNFYIKDGRVDLENIQGKVETIVSLRAEIRDKDAVGNPILITLTAHDQHLDLERFKPVITTSPPMSDSQIMLLLGQTAVGDVNKGNANLLKETIITASDIFAQMGLARKLESSVRNFFKLDVFSMRTLVIQNLVLGNLFNLGADKPLTIGNYFDNTSVYIGKYFGSAIYADAMLHLSYYDSLAAKDETVRKPVYGNLLFQPEIGLEMNTPFFLLRWHIAPTRPDSMFVSDTGLTISWKFSY